jgi:integrase
LTELVVLGVWVSKTFGDIVEENANSPHPSSHPRAGTAGIAAISFPTGQKPKLLDQVRHAIHTRHYSPKTEESYIGWIKRFIFFHNKRHPVEMGETEIARFLSSLPSESHVSASTQNQALNAVLFLYREVLRKEIGYVNGVVRAKRPKRLPVVLTRQEVRTIFGFLDGSDCSWSCCSMAPASD